MSTALIRRETLTEQLLDTLRTDLILGLFAPDERLRASDLTQRYGVSATPIREALQRLAADGLVRIDPIIGARVAPVSLQDIREIYELRLMLEPEALRRAIERGEPEWKASLTRTLDQLQRTRKGKHPTSDASREAVLAWSRAHRDFHMALYSGCGSSWLLKLIELLYDHSERQRMITAGYVEDPNLIAAHRRVHDAALRGDTKEAIEALTTFLRARLARLENAHQPKEATR